MIGIESSMIGSLIMGNTCKYLGLINSGVFTQRDESFAKDKPTCEKWRI